MIEISEDLIVAQELDGDGEVEILRKDAFARMWLNKEQAEELIDHLQKLFKLENKDD